MNPGFQDQSSKAADFVTACVKALMAAPKQFLRREESTLFDQKDIESMSRGRMQNINAAVDVMRKCRTWVRTLGLQESNSVVARLIGTLTSSWCTMS